MNFRNITIALLAATLVCTSLAAESKLTIVGHS